MCLKLREFFVCVSGKFIDSMILKLLIEFVSMLSKDHETCVLMHKSHGETSLRHQDLPVMSQV